MYLEGVMQKGVKPQSAFFDKTRFEVWLTTKNKRMQLLWKDMITQVKPFPQVGYIYCFYFLQLIKLQISFSRKVHGVSWLRFAQHLPFTTWKCSSDAEHWILTDSSVIFNYFKIVPKVRGFTPGQERWMFKGDKNPQYAFVQKGSKAVDPMS
jgi:hypothetical protein